MSKNEKPWAVDCFSIIPNPTETKILMWFQQQGVTLPHLPLPDANDFGGPKQLIKWVHEKVANDAVYLYSLYEQHFDEESRSVFIGVFENQHSTVERGDWIGPEQLDTLTLAHPEHKEIIASYFREVTSGLVPEQRAPWGRPGWYASAESWIRQQLQEVRQEDVVSIEIEQSWDISCVLKVQTDADKTYYFKASPDFPTFVNEATVMTGLAKIYPVHIPAPLAIEAAQRWMLTAGFVGHDANEGADTARHALLWRTFATLQVDSTQRIEQLLTIGCLDRRLDKLRCQIDPLLKTEAVLSTLEPTEIAELKRLAPQLKDRIDLVGRYMIPPALVHGDLHLGNVFVRGDTLLFFDWSDASITHPFIEQDRVYLERDEKIRDRLRNEYLAEWTDFESPAQLRHLWELMEPLCHLHYAVGYQQIDAAMENDVFDWVTPDRLRLILKCMA